jgi:hypothetical protein
VKFSSTIFAGVKLNFLSPLHKQVKLQPAQALRGRFHVVYFLFTPHLLNLLADHFLSPRLGTFGHEQNLIPVFQRLNS